MGYFKQQNAVLDRLIDDYFINISKYINDYWNGDLIVLLLGSMSRSEGTWMNIDSHDLIISDLEFFTIHPKSFLDFRKYEDIIQTLGKEMFSGVVSDLFHIDNTFIEISKLRRVEKKLLIFDALQTGLFVVGKDIRSFFPKITIYNINLFDIRDILLHRVFSILYFGEKMKENENKMEYRYLLAKNSLDLMTIQLVENGILASGFGNRLNRLIEIGIGTETIDYFKFCLSIKFGQPCDTDYSIKDMESKFYELSMMLYKNFKIPLMNTIFNLRHIIRRILGIIKRCIIHKHIPVHKFYLNMLDKFKLGIELSKEDVLNSLIINGYPLIKQKEAIK